MISQSIPKIIHQIWIGSKPKPNLYMDTWAIDYITANPSYTYCFWDEEKINKLMEFHHVSRTLYDGEQMMCGKADIARCFILYYHGGIYIDADSVWINHKSLDPLIESTAETGGDFFITKEPPKDWFANGVIGCTPYNDKIRVVIAHLESQADTYDAFRADNHPWKITGPLLFNILNPIKPQCPFVIAYHDRRVGLKFFADEEAGLDAFDLMDGGTFACVLINLISFETIRTYGLERYASECKKFVSDLYTSITVFPEYYFYPIKWHGINDPQLHLKMELNPDSYMFQYGITSNKLVYW